MIDSTADAGNKHVLYETGDADAPQSIKDHNGEVVLSLCRICGRGEVELDGPCVKPTADAAKLLPCPPWRSMKTAPLDETPVLLHTACHGIVEAWYSPGHWEDYHEGREYYGAQWVCADDAFQIEVEELPEEEGGFHHGTATAWMPLVPANTLPQPAPPAGEPDWDTLARKYYTDSGDRMIEGLRYAYSLGLAARPKVEDADHFRAELSIETGRRIHAEAKLADREAELAKVQQVIFEASNFGNQITTQNNLWDVIDQACKCHAARQQQKDKPNE